MRKWFVFVVATSWVLGATGMAGAASLNWSGTATVIVADFPPFLLYGGGVATVNSSSGGVPAHLDTLRLAASRGQVAGTDTVFITDPETAGNAIGAIIWRSQGGTGTLAPISGGVETTTALTRNVMPVYGMAKICILTTSCVLFLELPLTAPTTVNGVPGAGVNGIGIGGLLTAGGYGGIRLSLQVAPWTIKTATAIDHVTTPGNAQTYISLTIKGWAHAPASTTSSTAQPSGVVQIVTPLQITSNIALGSYSKMSGLITAVIYFIPEPGLLLLLGSGVAGLGLLGRRRMR